MMTESYERLVRRYLDRLEHALAGAPKGRGREVLDEIEAHIREEIAQLGRGPRDHEILEILDRVGEPEEIAAETYQPPPAEVVAPRSRTLEVFALLFLTVGGFVLPILGWVVGLILLWISQRWSTNEKVLGTFIPVALAGTSLRFFMGASQTCTGGTTFKVLPSGRTKRFSEPMICESSGLDPWVTSALFVTMALVAIGFTFYLAWRLSRPRPA